ncbi:MAG: DUF1957 domain-containing protein [Roseiflexus sp.]|nr:DUF1957 domain-containing protein [Roseiflexus sp.]MCS7288364.1 DUF1957 domain-containing protein [Roseiflexus sp.]MDW8146514.1 DUF1957 domain-containing protein [Roseiflexaceae bacterium]MDW8231207.1 DUF1957 domain-containing protein [Roseiflexaceae bacterium]
MFDHSCAERPVRSARARYAPIGVTGVLAGIARTTGGGEAEDLVVEIARRFPDACGDRERALNQAAHGLLLARSSDWLPLLGRNDASEACHP